MGLAKKECRFYYSMSAVGWLMLFMLLLLPSGSVQAQAYLSDFEISSAVDSYTFAPLDSQRSFKQSAPEVWATTFINRASEAVQVDIDWLSQRGDQYQKVLGSRLEAEGDRYIAFRLQPLEGEPLPAGKYRVRFKLNGDEQGTIDFRIMADQVAGPPAIETPVPVTTDKVPATRCIPPQESEAEIVEMVGGAEAQQVFGFGRYTDPENRFSMIVPGSWFPGETGDPNEALFLSQNMENDPVAWFVVDIYNAHLTPKFGAEDTVDQLREMFIAEGGKRGAIEVELDGGETKHLAERVATGQLALYYEPESGQQILQVHHFVVDGEYGFNIQMSVEMDKPVGNISADNTAEMVAYLLSTALDSLWTQQLCEQGKVASQ